MLRSNLLSVLSVFTAFCCLYDVLTEQYATYMHSRFTYTKLSRSTWQDREANAAYDILEEHFYKGIALNCVRNSDLDYVADNMQDLLVECIDKFDTILGRKSNLSNPDRELYRFAAEFESLKESEIEFYDLVFVEYEELEYDFGEIELVDFSWLNPSMYANTTVVESVPNQVLLNTSPI